MQLPKRRSQLLKKRDEDQVIYLTPDGLLRLQATLKDLKTRQQPKAIEDVGIAVQKGDLSENAEYQEARARLSSIQSRIFSIEDRLRRVRVIQAPDSSDTIQLGSTVTVRVNHQEKTYEILGPQETDPSRGRISHQSPLGIALIGHAQGDTVHLSTEQGVKTYEIIKIQ